MLRIGCLHTVRRFADVAMYGVIIMMMLIKTTSRAGGH